MEWTITIYIISHILSPRAKEGDVWYYLRAEKGGRSVKEQAYSSRYEVTTRNRSYLEALLEAVGRLNMPSARVDIITDSRYMVLEMERLGEREQAKFLKKDGEPVKNADLWGKIAKAGQKYRFRCSFMAAEDIMEETGDNTVQ